MGAARLKSHENEREIFLFCPRLSYVSPKGVNKPQPDPTVPRAYLKYIHYDQDSQFVSMGHMPISDEANEGYQQLLLQLVAQEDGFVHQPHNLAHKTLVLCPVANETLRDVYFDDITGMVRRPKIIQEGHYNPFGLPLAGLTTLGNPEYAYFFTGKELYEDEALQWYDYGARMYDVQIGRWTSHDPLYQMHTPYGYCGNNAVNYSDPDGRWFGLDDLVAAGVGFAIGYVGAGLTTGDWGVKALKNGLYGAAIGWVSYATAGVATAAGYSALGVGVVSGAAGGTVAGGIQGYEIGKAKGASGFADWASYIGSGMTIGAVAGGLAGATAGGLSSLGASSTFGAFIQGAASGAVGGGLNGMGMTSLAGSNESQVLEAAWKGATIGAVVGGAINSAAFKINDWISNREGMRFANELDKQGKKLNIQNESDLQKAIEENPHLKRMWERAGRPKLQFDGDYKYKLNQDKVLGYTEPTGNSGELRTCFTNQNTNNAEFYWTAHHEFRHALNAKFLGMGFPVGIEHFFMQPRDNWNLKFLGVYF